MYRVNTDLGLHHRTECCTCTHCSCLTVASVSPRSFAPYFFYVLQSAKALSQALNEVVNCLPGQREMEEALKLVNQAMQEAEVRTEKGREERENRREGKEIGRGGRRGRRGRTEGKGKR